MTWFSTGVVEECFCNLPVGSCPKCKETQWRHALRSSVPCWRAFPRRWELQSAQFFSAPIRCCIWPYTDSACRQCRHNISACVHIAHDYKCGSNTQNCSTHESESTVYLIHLSPSLASSAVCSFCSASNFEMSEASVMESYQKETLKTTFR